MICKGTFIVIDPVSNHVAHFLRVRVVGFDPFLRRLFEFFLFSVSSVQYTAIGNFFTTFFTCLAELPLFAVFFALLPEDMFRIGH